MIHSEQLKITDADISFAAPLSFDVRLIRVQSELVICSSFTDMKSL